MYKEERYIAEDGEVFRTSAECLAHEYLNFIDDYQHIIFYDEQDAIIDVTQYRNIEELLKDVFAVKVITVEEAKKIWELLLTTEEYNINSLSTRKNPFLNSDDTELIETIVVYDRYYWCSLSTYLSEKFEKLNNLGCTSTHLLALYQSFQNERNLKNETE